MTTEQEYLELTERRIFAAERRIALQRQRIERMLARGQDVTRAKQLLAISERKSRSSPEVSRAYSEADWREPRLTMGLRVRPKTSSRITELSQHEADGGEFQECKRAAVEIFPVLGEAPAAVEPGDRAFDDPTLG